MQNHETASHHKNQGSCLQKSMVWGLLLITIPLLAGCYERVVSVKGGPYNGMVYKGNLDNPSEQSSNAARMSDRANADYQKQLKELQKPREN